MGIILWIRAMSLSKSNFRFTVSFGNYVVTDLIDRHLRLDRNIRDNCIRNRLLFSNVLPHTLRFRFFSGLPPLAQLWGISYDFNILKLRFLSLIIRLRKSWKSLGQRVLKCTTGQFVVSKFVLRKFVRLIFLLLGVLIRASHSLICHRARFKLPTRCV